MWREQTSKQPRRQRRRSQQLPSSRLNEIQLTNTQNFQLDMTKKAKEGQSTTHMSNRPKEFEEKSQKSLNKSLNFHPSDGEATKRTVQTIKIAQARMTEIKKECRYGCLCNSCQDMSLARRSRIDNMREVLWSGPLILHPNTDKYRMTKASLTYQGLLDIPLDKNLTKIKYLVDKDLYVPVIKLTHGQRETRVLPNRKEGMALFIQFLLCYLAVHERFWTKFAMGDEAEGLIYRRYSLKGQWQRVKVIIRRGTLKQNWGEQRLLRSQCLWSTFQVMEWEMPHVVIKVWDGIWKVEYGLPINRLAEWLSAFLSLVAIQ